MSKIYEGTVQTPINRHVSIGSWPDIDLCDKHHIEQCKKLKPDYCYLVCSTLSEGCVMCETEKHLQAVREWAANKNEN